MPDVSLAWSLQLCMLNRRLYSSFTSENVCLPRKASRTNYSDPLPKKPDVLLLSVARPLQAYFIINNRIYQSPDMYTVLSNRLARPFSFFFLFYYYLDSIFCPVTLTLSLPACRDLADVALFPGIVPGHPAQVQARLHAQDGVCVAHHGDDGKGRRRLGRRGQQEADG